VVPSGTPANSLGAGGFAARTGTAASIRSIAQESARRIAVDINMRAKVENALWKTRRASPLRVVSARWTISRGAQCG
jgi:hypothetical protein